MIYLLAKYTLLFLLTAILGFILGYWYSRRNFEDVSESYEDLRRANARSDEAQWNRLWERLAALPQPKETDLSGVEQRLEGLGAAVNSLPKPQPVNFEPIETRLDSLTERVRNIPVPIKPEPVDLNPLQTELRALRDDVKQMPVVETHPAVDLAPVNARIDSLNSGIKAIPKPEPVDLRPIDRRLNSIETELSRLRKRLASIKATPVKAPPSARSAPRKQGREQPRVLSAALYGEKDDLKLISGVGPKLEKLLNENGVYYFWQVAEWNKRDIDIIDDRLEVFRGRISRDNWVDQAKRLRREPGAASMPKNI